MMKWINPKMVTIITRMNSSIIVKVISHLIKSMIIKEVKVVLLWMATKKMMKCRKF